MRKILIFLMVLLLTVGFIVGCSDDDVDDDNLDNPAYDVGPEDDQPDQELPKLATPVITVSSDGIASWDAIPGAQAYKAYVNGTMEITTDTFIQLNDGDRIRVCAAGDGMEYADSPYTDVYTFVLKAPTVVTPISEMADAPVGKPYLVRGIVCAAGTSNLMLTDNDGSYLYVYTEQPHGYEVGDEIEISGIKKDYWNIYELIDIIDSRLISEGNEIETPFVVEGDSEYVLDVLESFTIGEYVTVTGRLEINGNYYNFVIDGVENVMFSLAYRGEPLENGKLYTVTGYMAFISGSTNKYINIIVTEIREADAPNTVTLCDKCGQPTDSGNHAELDCGHYACSGGNHTALGCGHYSCQGGEHGNCEYCGGYLCTGDHTSCTEPVLEYCDKCGQPLDEGNHSVLSCGHYACSGGNHTALGCGHYACQGGEHGNCEYCGGYLCTGDHTSCTEPAVEYCDKCGQPLDEGNHSVLSCGHYACSGGNHTALGCGHYACSGGNHTALDCGHYACSGGNHAELDCGHYSCQGGEHGNCEYCGGYLCTGDHTSCAEPALEYCDKCGQPLGEGNHSVLSCGHYACSGGNHAELDCGHYACSGGNHTVLSCGHYACSGGNHTALGCGHYACQSENHTTCTACGGYLCVGNHTTLSCGHKSCEAGNHSQLDCGHYACESGDHTVCEGCGEYLCVGDHSGTACMKKSAFTEIMAGEDEEIFCAEGVICAYGAYELMITDNNGNYLHIPFEVQHPYTVGDRVRVVGYKYAMSNVTYQLIPIEIKRLDSDNEIEAPTAKTVYADYFVDGRDNGYKMGDYIKFTATLDTVNGEFYLNDMYAYIIGIWTDYEVYVGESYTVTGYLLYISPDVCYVIVTGFSSYNPSICPACGQLLLVGNHDLLDCGHRACEPGDHTKCSKCGSYKCYYGSHDPLPCGHLSCESGDHSQCSSCGGYYCHGGEHGFCFGCKGRTCDGGEHGFCGVCGWYLCVGNHDILPCGHRACLAGDHIPCDTCGEYRCLGGDHSLLVCSHKVCEGGVHKMCPTCGEFTCNAPDHELCAYCGRGACVGDHKACPVCLKATCNLPDHTLCGVCGEYLCVGDHSHCMGDFYIGSFSYHVSYQVQEHVVYCEDGDPSKPLIQLIGGMYRANMDYTIHFYVHDDNTFVLNADIPYLDENGEWAYLTSFTFTGIYTPVDGGYAIEVTGAISYFTTIANDLMEYPGTYFPHGKIAIVYVNEQSRTMEVPDMIAFILGCKDMCPELYAPCYYCKQIVLPGEVNLHTCTCSTCGKQYCEMGGVQGHLYYELDVDEYGNIGPYARHYPVAEEDRRHGIVFGSGVAGESDAVAAPASFGKDDDEE